MKYDVIVIGGGHAGTEAAAAAARMGAKTAIYTLSADNPGELSCNPSIGGIGKTHLVREIDALDGVMAIAADKAAIGYRTLNSSKGAAVQGLRAQLDRKLYKKAVRGIISKYGINIIEGEVADIKTLPATAIIVTSGTFLNGVLHTGKEQTKGGRMGERAATKLSKSLLKLGIKLKRLKTGTPARLDAGSINWGVLEQQEEDWNGEFFSYSTKKNANPERPCFMTATNALTHEVIRKAAPASPMFSGQITGIGARYCPSIEDKVIRFPHHATHRIFLEPEGVDSNVIYPNGVSTSLPAEVQEKFLRTIKGLENVKILAFGYAVEYDAIDARELESTLAHHKYPWLFFAGQVNGTSGYEEAAAQGIIAGTNAALFALTSSLPHPRPVTSPRLARRHSPLASPIKASDFPGGYRTRSAEQTQSNFTLDRTEAFIGVLIGDITTLGADEPYRMFTARSEYRLSLRPDNADKRLTEKGAAIGLVRPARLRAYKSRKLSALEEAIEKTYSGYLRRQGAEIERYKNEAGLLLPKDLDYKKISGLTLEAADKLARAKPASIAQAALIPGVTPAALIALLKFAKKPG
jgi:tRNA uridine 5-carboxymethylaminomethyl modification enzyme